MNYFHLFSTIDHVLCALKELTAEMKEANNLLSRLFNKLKFHLKRFAKRRTKSLNISAFYGGIRSDNGQSIFFNFTDTVL